MSDLILKDVELSFGGLTAVQCLNFSAERSQIQSIIGPNGAGKTSAFNLISGIYVPSRGEIFFKGQALRAVLKSKHLLLFLLVGLISYFAALVSFNIEALWQVGITDNFIYEGSFPWGSALRQMLTLSTELAFSTAGILPFLAGVLGVWGSYLLWSRNRINPNLVARAGIGRTFQNLRLFPQMTVLENVLVARERSLSYGVLSAAFRSAKYREEEKQAASRAMELLEFVSLAEKASMLAGSLSYGQQKRLEIARALALEPEFLLLDEPAAGLNHTEAEELTQLIKKIAEQGIGVILIEHHMPVVMKISSRICVLDYGNKIAEGTPEEICSNPKVIAAYLGAEEVRC